MKQIILFLTLTSINIYSQQEPIMIEGIAQGTSYHITYFDKKIEIFNHKLIKF
jgi:hypothetical protein